MKKTIFTFAIAAFSMLAATPEADARSHRGHHSNHVYVSGYRSCGTPIYTERYVIRHRPRCGTPVWGYRVVPAPVRYAPPHRRHYRPAVCPPHHPYPHRRGGVVIQGSFRL
jgi:hypothetical protein